MGEGTGGEAHELKQGAHDEEEEPVHCSTHAHTRKYAQSTEADDEGMNMLCVCVCVRFIARGRGGYRCCNLKTFGTFSSSSSSPSPPPSTGMWPTLMMSLRFSALPVFCSSTGTGERERGRDGEIRLTKSIFPLRQQRRGSAESNKSVAAALRRSLSSRNFTGRGRCCRRLQTTSGSNHQ